MEKIEYAEAVIEITQNVYDLSSTLNTCQISMLRIALNVMNDAMNSFRSYCEQMKYDVPDSKIFISHYDEVNAFTDGKRIVVFDRLIFDVDRFVEERYSDTFFEIYHENYYNPYEFRMDVKLYALGYLSLHEVFHAYHDHLNWLNNHKVSSEGEVRKERRNDIEKYLKEVCLTYDQVVGFEDEANTKRALSQLKEEFSVESIEEEYITQQALEFDADINTVSYLIILLSLQKRQSGCNLSDYFKKELPKVMSGMLTIMYMFNASHSSDEKNQTLEEQFRRNVDCLKYDTHPNIGLRFDYFEHQMFDSLADLDLSYDDIQTIEREWFRLAFCYEDIIRDILGDNTPFREFSLTYEYQEHLSLIKKRYNDIYDSLFGNNHMKHEPRIQQSDIDLYKEVENWFQVKGNTFIRKKVPTEYSEFDAN